MKLELDEAHQWSAAFKTAKALRDKSQQAACIIKIHVRGHTLTTVVQGDIGCVIVYGLP